MRGELVEIWTAPGATADMAAATEAEVVTARGIVGDRYAEGRGTWSGPARAERQQVTLIESETLAALTREGVEAGDGLHRRNLVTRGIALNHLVGRELIVGDVRLRGVKLCEPCTHLDEVAGRPLRLPLVHRGGLNCAVIAGGTIRIGDIVGPVGIVAAG